MKRIFAILIALQISIFTGLAMADDNEKQELTSYLRGVFAQPGMREVAEECRSKAQQLDGDPEALEAFLQKYATDESRANACSAGLVLFKNKKGGNWTVSEVVDLLLVEYAQYREKAYCAALRSDLKNYKTSLEAFYADNMAYPKTSDFKPYPDSEKGALALMSEGTVIYYTPSQKFQKYTVTARSEKCPYRLRTTNDSYEIEEIKTVKK